MAVPYRRERRLNIGGSGDSMIDHTKTRRGPITRNALGPSAAEAFVIVAIATILLTGSTCS